MFKPAISYVNAKGRFVTIWVFEYWRKTEMRVFVTGADGYIGRHVVKELLDNKHEVIANDITYNGVDDRAQCSDIQIFSRNPEIFYDTGKPDLLIHMAWQYGFVHNHQAHMECLSDHVIFLSNMARAGCKRIASIGTMHEVGYWEGMVDENTPCKPMSCYAIAKNALRQHLLLISREYGFNLYWLRAFYIYGDDIHGSSIFSKIMQSSADGKKEFPFTSGKNKYDFISVYDLSKQIVAASTQDEDTGIINVCTGKPISLAEQIEKCISDNHLNIKLLYGAFPDRPYDSPAIWGDNTIINRIMSRNQV